MLIWFIKFFYVNFLFFNILLDIEFILLYINLIFVHIFYGLISIIKDYVHVEELIILLNFLIRLLLLNMIIISIEFVF